MTLAHHNCACSGLLLIVYAYHTGKGKPILAAPKPPKGAGQAGDGEGRAGGRTKDSLYAPVPGQEEDDDDEGHQGQKGAKRDSGAGGEASAQQPQEQRALLESADV